MGSSCAPLPLGEGTSIAQLLATAQTRGLDRLDAQLLLLHVLKKQNRAWLLAHDTDNVSTTDHERFVQLCARRIAGEPIAYLLGSKEFFGLNLHVDPRVLVPRPDTETLVEWALEMVKEGSVLDLGTGSGAIALAIKKARPQAQVCGVDASLDALTVAAENASRLALQVDFILSNWFEKVSCRFGVIVSNPPYVAALDPHLAALTHEPVSALTSGADGLDDIRQIVAQAPNHLAPGGWLLLEHGYDQAPQVRQLLTKRGFSLVASRVDLGGIERCSGGQWII